MPVAHQPPHQVGAHPAESDHSDLRHGGILWAAGAPGRLSRSARLRAWRTRRIEVSQLGPPGDALVTFGITGDLAKKMTLKALYDLTENGALQVPVIGVGRTDWSDDDLDQHAREAIEARVRGGGRGDRRGRLQEVRRLAQLRPGRLQRLRDLPES